MMMRNLILIVFAFALSVSAFGQKKKRKEEVKIETPSFSYDEASKLITYGGVNSVTGSSGELYAKGLAWMKSYYKNPTDVIRVKDMEAGKLQGRGRFRIWDQKEGTGSKTLAGLVEYEITILSKEGKYKYEITKIGKKAQTFYPAEKWEAENKAAYKRMYASYLVQVDEELRKVEDSLINYMSATPAATKEDW